MSSPVQVVDKPVDEKPEVCYPSDTSSKKSKRSQSSKKSQVRPKKAQLVEIMFNYFNNVSGQKVSRDSLRKKTMDDLYAMASKHKLNIINELVELAKRENERRADLDKPSMSDDEDSNDEVEEDSNEVPFNNKPSREYKSRPDNLAPPNSVPVNIKDVKPVNKAIIKNVEPGLDSSQNINGRSPILDQRSTESSRHPSSDQRSTESSRHPSSDEEIIEHTFEVIYDAVKRLVGGLKSLEDILLSE